MNLLAQKLSDLPSPETLAKIHAEGIAMAMALATGYEPEPAELLRTLNVLTKSILNSYLGYCSSLPEIERQIQELYSEDALHGIQKMRRETLAAIEKLEEKKLNEALR